MTKVQIESVGGFIITDKINEEQLKTMQYNDTIKDFVWESLENTNYKADKIEIKDTLFEEDVLWISFWANLDYEILVGEE